MQFRVYSRQVPIRNRLTEAVREGRLSIGETYTAKAIAAACACEIQNLEILQLDLAAERHPLKIVDQGRTQGYLLTTR